MSEFLNISQEFYFISSLLTSFSTIISTNFSDSYKIPTLIQLSETISSSNESIFVSTKDSTLSWDGPSDINFFLFEQTSKFPQLNYLNNFTIYTQKSAQEEKCSEMISLDFWAYNIEYCESDYKYQSALDLTSSTDKKCYVMVQGYSESQVSQRYVEQKLFDQCQDVNETTFSGSIMEYWNYADNAYELHNKFSTILNEVDEEFSVMDENITNLINNLHEYYASIENSEGYIINIINELEDYYIAMNCSMVKDLTSQLYLGLCGEILDYLFFFSLFAGTLAFSLFLFSLSVVLILFRFRTDLEIEQDNIIRSIGLEKNADPEATDRIDETIIKN